MQVGETITLSDHTWRVTRALDRRERSFLITSTTTPERTRWLWIEDRPPQTWLDAISTGLGTSSRMGLPEFRERVTLEDGRVAAMMRHPRPTTPPLQQEAWRALPDSLAIEALQRLTLAIGELHTRGVTLGGLRRDQLCWDAARTCLYVCAMPEMQPFTGAPKQVWRDIKLIGELLYENLLGRSHPGGHKMAELLQDRQRMRTHGGWRAGLPQVLAGCVTPYGDTAFATPHELWVALETLRIEQTARLTLDVGSRSTVGSYLFRHNNQDACGHVVVETTCGSTPVSLGFFCVADGIGGIEDGERASGLAVQTGCAAFGRISAHRHGQVLLEHPVATARGIAQVVGQRLALEGEFDPRGNRGGTTFSALLLAGHRVGIAHAGDSRIYLLRQGQLIQLTRDHTVATLIRELGTYEEATAAERESHERTISRFLTSRAELPLRGIDTFSTEAADALASSDESLIEWGLLLEPGDLFLLTSDGVHGVLSDTEITEMARAHEQAQPLCDAIVDEVIARIGRDNATALAVRVG